MKNKLSLLIAGSLLSLSSIVLADHVNSEFDTDGDGIVTAAEVLVVKTADFESAAGDDSLLSLEEFTALQETIQVRRLTAAFEDIDTSGDGLITSDEFIANATTDAQINRLTNAFTLAETDGDSALSADEFASLHSSKGSDIMAFVRLDTDYDQAISLAEYTAAPVHGGGRGSKSGGKKGRR